MCANVSTGVRPVAIGDIELASLPDAVGLLDELETLYPDVALEDWEPYRELYPTLFSGSKWRLPVACFLVKVGNRTILVDAGVGPPGSWDWEGEREGGLPAALATCGVDPSAVDTLFLSHLHVDHVGWLQPGGPFERARIAVHADALAFAIENSRLDWLPARLRELVDGGRVETVGSGVELDAGVRTHAYPGHYPGHLGLELEARGERAVMIADAAVHPALLDHPDWRYGADVDHAQCASTRRTLVADLVDSGTLVAAHHYTGGAIGRIVSRDGRVVWEEAA